MKQYYVAIGIRENEVTKASFSTENSAKEYTEYLKGTSKESFYCLVRQKKTMSFHESRKITRTLASRMRYELLKVKARGTVNSYYYVDRNTWLSSSFGHGVDAMYYDSYLFGVSFDNFFDGEVKDVTCILHSEYLTWSTMLRMQSACRLLPYAVKFRIINGEPWLEGNYKQVKVPVDKPFSLMRYIKVLFNEF